MDRILAFDTQTLIQMGLMLFNVLLTIFILYKLLYKPVTQFLKKRSDNIASQLKCADISAKSAENLLNEYHEKLNNIEGERAQIIESAHKRALVKESKMVIEAKKEVEIIKNRATLDMEREQEQVKDEVKKQIIEISTLIAERFVTTSIDRDTQKILLNGAISDLEGAKWLNQ